MSDITLVIQAEDAVIFLQALRQGSHLHGLKTRGLRVLNAAADQIEAVIRAAEREVEREALLAAVPSKTVDLTHRGSGL